MFKSFKNYFFVFFILLLTSCNKGGGISDTANQPIFVPQDTEMEGFLADTISDELIKYYYIYSLFQFIISIYDIVVRYE